MSNLFNSRSIAYGFNNFSDEEPAEMFLNEERARNGGRAEKRKDLSQRGFLLDGLKIRFQRKDNHSRAFRIGKLLIALDKMKFYL